MTTLAIFIQHSIESLRARKEIKGIKIGKEDVPVGDDVGFVIHCNSVLVNTTGPSSATF